MLDSHIYSSVFSHVVSIIANTALTPMQSRKYIDLIFDMLLLIEYLYVFSNNVIINISIVSNECSTCPPTQYTLIQHFIK